MFIALAAITTLYIALPRREDARPDTTASADIDDLRAEREALVLALRDLDDDVAAGRMAAADRQRGRQEIGVRLRAVIDLLHAHGERP